jgi:hypothetical protein
MRAVAVRPADRSGAVTHAAGLSVQRRPVPTAPATSARRSPRRTTCSRADREGALLAKNATPERRCDRPAPRARQGTRPARGLRRAPPGSSSDGSPTARSPNARSPRCSRTARPSRSTADLRAHCGMACTLETVPSARARAAASCPHEQTFSGPKEDRKALMKATATQLSPIFGLHPDDSGAATRSCAASCDSRPADMTADLGDGVHPRGLDDRGRRRRPSRVPRRARGRGRLHRRRAPPVQHRAQLPQVARGTGRRSRRPPRPADHVRARRHVRPRALHRPDPPRAGRHERVHDRRVPEGREGILDIEPATTTRKFEHEIEHAAPRGTRTSWAHGLRDRAVLLRYARDARPARDSFPDKPAPGARSTSRSSST